MEINMNQCLLLLIAILFSSLDGHNVNDRGSNNDWGKMDLKGRVKSVTEEQCRIIIKSGENRTCKVKRKIIFNSNGHIVEDQTWEFSRLIERRILTYSKTALDKIESFDQKDSLIRTYLFVYDQSGNRIEEKIFSTGNVPSSRYTYLYDENRRKIQMDGYNMNTGGNHFIKETFTYDNFGNLIKETSEHASENSSKEFSYKYDKERKIVETTVRAIYEKLGKYSTTTRYKYDSEDNVVEESQTDNGRKSTTIITVDKTGNWVKRKTNESKNTFLTTERTLEYF
jgi:hypothetical protein